MPRYRTGSWRAFDPAAHAAKAVAPATVRLPVATAVRILGIDPGSQRTGFGVIECGNGNSKSLVHGCIAAGSGGSFNERLRRIFEGVQELIDRYRPDEIAIER